MVEADKAKGNDPYLLGIFGEEIVFKNNNGEVYWSFVEFQETFK